MIKRYGTLVFGLFISLTLLVPLVWIEGIAAQEDSWLSSSSVITLTTDPDLEQRSAMALASNTRMAALWSEEGTGAKICFYDGSGWSQPQLLMATDVDIFWPTLTYSGTEALAAWVEGGISAPSNVVQMDTRTMHTKTVMSGVIGTAAPDLEVGPDKAHLLFASAQDNNSSLETDIYYTTRDLGETAWLTPTKIITYGQVTPPDSGGIIFYPEMALSQDGQTVHIVWEQGYGFTSWAIWYVAGTWTPDGKITWNAPQQISPVGELGTRPALAVDASDRVHIAWMRPEPDRGASEGQQVFYQQLNSPVEPVQLNQQSLQVNDNFPTLVELSMAAEGEDVCVTWHGHHGESGESDTEEIWMRCSPDAGVSWQSVINVSASSDEHSLFSNIQLDAQGAAYATWVEYKIEGTTKLPQSLNVRTGPSTFNRIFLPLVMR